MNHESNRRPDRIAELMQRKLAYLVQHEIDDPRLPSWMTILDVKLSKDLSVARVYFTAIDDKPQELVDVLNVSAPFLRQALAKSLSLRKVPRLRFVYDASVEYGQRLSSLIDKANDDDDAA